MQSFDLKVQSLIVKFNKMRNFELNVQQTTKFKF